MKTKLTTLITTLLFLSFSGQAGWLFDDPVEFTATYHSNLFAKDEIKLTPSGKCANFMILNGEYTFELKYATSTRILTVNQVLVSEKAPLTFTVPDGSKGLLSWRLTAPKVSSQGKLLGIWVPKDKQEPLPAGRMTPEQILKRFKQVRGYKIELEWWGKWSG